MKRYLVAIFILALAAAAYPKEIRQMFKERAAVTVTPTAKNYIMASYSSAQGWDLRRMAEDSVLKAGGMDTTAADGTRYVKPYNSTSFSGTPEEGMLQTTPTGVKVYFAGGWRTLAFADYSSAGDPTPPSGCNDQTIRPTLIANETNWTASAGTNIAAISDNSDSTYSSTATTYSVLQATTPDVACGSGTIASVTVYVRGSSASSSPIRIGISPHNVLAYSGDKSLASTITTVSETWAINPRTTSAWTIADLNDAIRTGIAVQNRTGTDVVIYDMWYVVDYQ